MDARAPRLAQGFRAAINVLLRRACKSRDRTVFYASRDFAHTLEIARTGDRKARFDDVDAQGVEQIGDLQFLLESHGGAWRLLAVAQCCIENNDAFRVMSVRGCGRPAG